MRQRATREAGEYKHGRILCLEPRHTSANRTTGWQPSVSRSGISVRGRKQHDEGITLHFAERRVGKNWGGLGAEKEMKGRMALFSKQATLK